MKILTLQECVESRRKPVNATPMIPGNAPTVFVMPWLYKAKEIIALVLSSSIIYIADGNLKTILGVIY